jgi:hypothetical protein
MSPTLLSWASLVFGIGAMVIYFAVLATRPRVIRMVNGSGLFLNGLGLIQVAVWVKAASPTTAWFNANVAVAALCLAAVAQAVSVLRNRQSWDGVERRKAPQPGAPPTERRS